MNLLTIRLENVGNAWLEAEEMIYELLDTGITPKYVAFPQEFPRDLVVAFNNMVGIPTCYTYLEDVLEFVT